MAGPQRANSLLKYSFSWPIGGVASCVFPVVRNASNPLYWDYFNRLLVPNPGSCQLIACGLSDTMYVQSQQIKYFNKAGRGIK